MADAITFCCVKWGTKYGPEYVNILADMVSRSYDGDYRFVCFTDDPAGLDDGIDVVALPDGLTGWWNKVYLFKPGFLDGRIMYFDLDVVITGRLEPVVEHGGIIDDWNLPGYNSSVMVWNAGDYDHLWTDFTPDVMQRLRGDQDWITEQSEWKVFPKEFCTSYKSELDWPSGHVVVFHGSPNPGDYPSSWVEKLWKKGGMGMANFQSQSNTAKNRLLKNIKMNQNRGKQVRQQQPNNRICMLVGGGPSLMEEINDRVVENWNNSHLLDVWSLNNTFEFLCDRGIKPDAQVMLDARKENNQFVHPQEGVRYYIASQCHPSIFNLLNRSKSDVWVWHARTGAGEETILQHPMIGGGGTVGMRAMYLAYVMGYREIHLIGYDSCFRGDHHHAYEQSLNDHDKPQEVVVKGRTFVAAPWMIRQAQDFQTIAKNLVANGCGVVVHGNGLIPWVAKSMEATDE